MSDNHEPGDETHKIRRQLKFLGPALAVFLLLVLWVAAGGSLPWID